MWVIAWSTIINTVRLLQAWYKHTHQNRRPSITFQNWEESWQQRGCGLQSRMKGWFSDSPLQLKSSAEATHFSGKGAFWSTGISHYCTQRSPAKKSRNKAFEVGGKHLGKHTDSGEKRWETQKGEGVPSRKSWPRQIEKPWCSVRMSFHEQ